MVRRIWRVVVVMVVAVVLGGFFIFQGDGPGAPASGQRAPGGGPPSCMGDVGNDSEFVVLVESDPPVARTTGTTYRMLVTRNDRPVSGVRVCLILDMPGMNMERAQEAPEVAPGRYEVPLSLPMAGRWVGEVRVAVTDRPGAVVPVDLDVE